MSLTSTIVGDLFEVQTNIKLYHWKTTSFSRHKAADELHEKLMGFGDELIETMTMRYGRPAKAHEGVVKLKNLDDEGVLSYLAAYCKKLHGYKFDKSHTDLHNIRDELLAVVNKTLYLMSLD